MLRLAGSLTSGIWKEPRLLSKAIDTPEPASPMITGDTVLCTAAQPELEPLMFLSTPLSLFTLSALEPVSGWPFTKSSDALRDTGMSSQLSRMWKPSFSCGRRSLRWLISLIAKVMVWIQRKARELKLYKGEKQLITKHKYIHILKYPEHKSNKNEICVYYTSSTITNIQIITYYLYILGVGFVLYVGREDRGL